MTRRTTLATGLLLAALGYFLLLLGSPAIDLPQERKLSAANAGEPRVHLYLELADVDAARDSMQIRVSIEPTGLGIDPRSMLPDRDLVLVLSHDQRSERIVLHAHQSIPTTTVELDLYDGNVTGYPLDAYRAEVSIRCLEASSLSDPQPTLLPIDLTIWERLLGFRLRTDERAGGPPGEQWLSFQIHRSRAFVFFTLAAYGAMVVLACVALTIGGLVFLGVRRPEATLVSALGAIVFALPSLRATLPGGAPLGVSADVFIFLWAELAAVCALALLVVAWARAGPKP